MKLFDVISVNAVPPSQSCVEQKLGMIRGSEIIGSFMEDHAVILRLVIHIQHFVKRIKDQLDQIRFFIQFRIRFRIQKRYASKLAELSACMSINFSL